MKLLFTILLFLNLLVAQAQEPPGGPPDTTASFKIGRQWATPKKSFDFNSLASASNDTLDVVTCADYVYAPFGSLDERTDLKNSLLKVFRITQKSKAERTQIYHLAYKSSTLALHFDDDPEASTHSYITRGEINDRDVPFANNIHIGMSAKQFYDAFFAYFPPELQKKFRVVIFESCVEDIQHVYVFMDGKLERVKFKQLP